LGIKQPQAFGKKYQPDFFGRHLSHSLLGIFLFGFIAKYLLGLAQGTLLVDMNIVWDAFMIGLFSHLFVDTLTTKGVPWLFPIPFHLGFPPFSVLRV